MAPLVLEAGFQEGLENSTCENALRRLARAEELGMTYREYALEILERGRFL